MTRAYLDHASTSPLRPAARAAMLEWMDAADPGRVHTEGRMARAALEDARDKVAALLGARSREGVFTSGATEAVAAAVCGAAGLRPDQPIVLAGVEHSCVRDSSARHPNTLVAVDRLGRVDAGALTSTDAALVHCQWANHEVGTAQPVVEVVERCRERGVL